ncbi:nucleoside hydrolase [Priestia megaterium]|uniref:nucleoside hydrolase n=1 Tax=Priestia megaterium TaxID=1404 RepID=UPI000BEE4B76|nr:nucleoside hydrolase [Priestia megaterium]PEA37038.1 pyrimidine-specific ribonucleoside hydrolase RihA [Priestia megaterium]PEE48959.1 pyrimidine-specific ribonucleoside hydrolase RihA [Priestia megaterium]
MSRPIIIDCDPGIDDALAIMLAIASNELDIKLITTCAGNQRIEKITLNTLKLLSFVDKEIEVAKGADKPLFKDLVLSEAAHGKSGFGEVELEELKFSVSDRSAIEAMKDTILNSEQKITIVAIGPLTNIALLIKSYPEVIKNINQLSIMGGACTGGNCTPVAEFNIYVDPDAAKIVFDSGIPITMFGLDVTHQIPMYKEDIDRIRYIGNKTGQFAAKMLDFYFKEDKIEGMHDPCPVAYLIDPSLFTIIPCNVEIETKGEFTRGQTVVDKLNQTGKPQNVKVALEVEREKILDMLYNAIKKLK